MSEEENPIKELEKTVQENEKKEYTLEDFKKDLLQLLNQFGIQEFKFVDPISHIGVVKQGDKIELFVDSKDKNVKVEDIIANSPAHWRTFLMLLPAKIEQVRFKNKIKKLRK